MKLVSIASLSCLLAGVAHAQEPAPTADAATVAQPVAVADAEPPAEATALPPMTPAASAAPAAAPMAAPMVLVRPAPSRAKGRFTTYASMGFNVYTHLGAKGSSPAADLTPASRAIVYQQLGVGYFFHPLLRVQLTFIFGETATGLPAGASTFTTFAIVPWLIFSTHGFFTGAGPQLAPVSYGKGVNFDAGIYTATGYAVPLGKGFTLPLSCQLVVMLNQRTSFAVTPAAALAYRF
jgi:hypothetical protein